MDFSASAAAIRTRLEDLNRAGPQLPLVWENQEFKPESNGGENGWIYTEIELSSSQQSSFGASNNWYRDYGLVTINVVIPRGTLIGRAESIATLLRTGFASESIPGIHFTNRWIGRGQLAGVDSRWFALPLYLEFWSDYLAIPDSGYPESSRYFTIGVLTEF